MAVHSCSNVQLRSIPSLSFSQDHLRYRTYRQSRLKSSQSNATNPNHNISLTLTLTLTLNFTRTLNPNPIPKKAFFSKKIDPAPPTVPTPRLLTPLLNGSSTYWSSKSHPLLKAKAKVVQFSSLFSFHFSFLPDNQLSQKVVSRYK